MMFFPKLIGDHMKVPPALIETALKLAHFRYRKIKVPKRSGGHRTIVQPAAELKLVQAWLNAQVLSLLPLSSIASAFRSGASILKNATIHHDSLYSVRVDIKDFFPSIRDSDLLKVIQANNMTLPSFVKHPEFSILLQKACFDRNSRLPIGYPSSPSIANVVMYDIDMALKINTTTNTDTYGNAQLTRYADDFIFSTDKPGACHAFVQMLKNQLNSSQNPRLSVNARKTRFMSRRGGSTLITGLRINQEGIVRIHANYRDHVRLLLKHYSSGSLNSDDIPKLKGHLAFIEHNDPKLFTRLSFRYFNEIGKLRGKQ